MFQSGTLLYFNPFYFKNGAASKPKYFIVLKDIDDKLILASLPSSRIYLPHRVPEDHGCIEIPEGCITCYLFEAGRTICTNGFAFPKLTAVYGEQLDQYDKSIIEDNYPVPGVDYEIIGQLLPEQLADLLQCLRNSSVVKRRYRQML